MDENVSCRNTLMLVAVAVLLLPALASCAARKLVDVRKVDWSNATIPGAACGAPGPIRLRDGAALDVPSDRWRSDTRRVEVYGGAAAVYGDITGDGRPEAAFTVSCNMPKSTASGQLAFVMVVFTATHHGVQAIGVLPAKHPTPPTLHPPLVNAQSLQPGKLIAEEVFYGPHDANCCASGRAETTWAYEKGQWRAVRTVTTRKARGRTLSR